MSKVGILILHGFTGNPRDAYDLRRYLAQTFTGPIVIPRLPGHGTKPEDLFKYNGRDWYAAARRAYIALAEKGPVVIVGVSFGANLMFRLAADPEIRSKPQGLIALGAPARMARQSIIRIVVKFMKIWTSTYIKRGPHQNEKIPGYRQSAYDRIPLVALEEFLRFLERYMRPALLARVTAPTLLVQSTIDPVVAPWSLAFFQRQLGSSDITVLSWDHHRHLLIQGGRKKQLFARIVEFIRRVS